MACNCEGNNYNINFGCTVPALVNANNYYTKSEVDEKLEEIIISGGGVTEDEVQDMIDTSLEDYYNKSDIDSMLEDHATKTWVLNQHFVTISELIQYINNLQEQINSLQEAISGCCGGSGETIYRWITMTSADDYVCSGTTKMTKEKKQQSTDNGVTWSDVSPLEIRMGDTVLEVDSVDCGYVPTNLKLSGVKMNGNTFEIPCNDSTILTQEEVISVVGTSKIIQIEIGDCVTEIGRYACSNLNYLESLTIPSGVTTIGDSAFYTAGDYSPNYTLTLNEGLVTIGLNAFSHNTTLSTLVIPNSVTTIENLAFNFNNLTNLTIGSGVQSIGGSAFRKTSGATPFESITVLATVPPTLGNEVFANATKCPIYVPMESVDAYKNASGWNAFADWFQPIA